MEGRGDDLLKYYSSNGLETNHIAENHEEPQPG
jgi:hypothetical protein